MALIAPIIINKCVIIFNLLKLKSSLNHFKAILKSKPNIY